ncbi:F510_1955 family glycosylhydrolase [Mesobacillus harenae]|uniref:F510_1955 family glycosylhydrolase n=1 Tax=Mesobacillus harenae TaxID=2213203 RepID=UPI0030D4B60E
MIKYLAAMGILTITISMTGCAQDNEQNQVEEEQVEQTEREQDAGTETQENSSGVIAASDFFESFTGKIDHIHGIGYVGNQNAPFYATHDGIKVYENGEWFKTKKENNDYMGFSPTAEGFYTSGHPGPGSDLPNPFGIKKSTDSGQTLQDIVLEGETDFHTMGAGYNNNTLFVLNPVKNSLMEANRFYHSEDGGKTWNEAKASGIEGEIINIAVHPDDSNVVAASGGEGVFLSENGGESFERVSNNVQGTAVYFSKDSLWYGGYSGDAMLIKRSLENGEEEEINLPEMNQDAVQYFAQNPQKEDELTFVSIKGKVYQTVNGASDWEIIVEDGKSK